MVGSDYDGTGGLVVPKPVRLDIHLCDQIAEVRRELGMRQRVYERWVNEGRMDGATADLRVQRMKAVLVTLLDLQAESESQSSLPL